MSGGEGLAAPGGSRGDLDASFGVMEGADFRDGIITEAVMRRVDFPGVTDRLKELPFIECGYGCLPLRPALRVAQLALIGASPRGAHRELLAFSLGASLQTFLAFGAFGFPHPV